MRYRDQPEDGDSDVLDMSIVGDEEEQHRIELEQNLQDLSIQLSVSNPSQASDHELSTGIRDEGPSKLHRLFEGSESSFEVEYPRHNPQPRDVSIFYGQNSSILNQQRDEDYDYNYYSYRTGDEDDGIHYVADTMSTAAHHASAVTLSTGLAGRGGKRIYGGEVSLSGAEYDPDRSLEHVMSGMANDLSMLDMNTPRPHMKNRSKISTAPVQVTFDPQTVDFSVDHSHSPPSGLDDITQDLRTSQGLDRSQTHDSSPRFRFGFDPKPRAKPKTIRPALNVQPPTPSTPGNVSNGSKFAKLAKNLAKEIEAGQQWTSKTALRNIASPHKVSQKNQSSRRHPFQDIVNQLPEVGAQTKRSKSKCSSIPAASSSRDVNWITNAAQPDVSARLGAVQLPDVTGLTSAVGSPVKRDLEWRQYIGRDEEGVEGHLLQTLTTLQTRLNQLESQNLVSRRRVRELELELEDCRAEVKRERTRVLEREEIIVAQQKDYQKQRIAVNRAARPQVDPVTDTQYQNVVEEKKALEALIATLRSHLSRLTDELSTQQAQLDEFRSLRESDLRNLARKMSEVDQLKLEVERLGGEVEILRGIVEEGLRERRKVKESLNPDNISDSLVSHISAAESRSKNDMEPDYRTRNENDDNGRSGPHDTAHPPSRPQSQQAFRPLIHDKTMRTGFATVGSPGATGTTRFLDEDELGRVSVEVEERRSERSHSISQDTGVSQPRPNQRGDTVGNRSPSSPLRDIHILDRSENLRSRVQLTRNNDSRSRRHSFRTSMGPASKQERKIETPFPQIRGERLERLFFSAPEHNARTCRVCHRRRRPSDSDDELDFPSWLPPRKRKKTGKEDGISRVMNTEEFKNVTGFDHNDRNQGAPKAPSNAPFNEDRLPPQTVLVRVVRELEDDFTHYKGIYIELADQYKLMDAASNVPKRNVLAEHLKDVINTLEQKGDQIASLYDLLTFKDKAVLESAVPSRRGSR